MAIADKLQSILDSKAAIKSAIEAKGVENVGDILADYPDKIAEIKTGSGGYTDYELEAQSLFLSLIHI